MYDIILCCDFVAVFACMEWQNLDIVNYNETCLSVGCILYNMARAQVLKYKLINY